MSTILILDDHAIHRKLPAALLTSEGHQIVEASDGADELVKARLRAPQFVIRHPHARDGGYEFVRRLGRTQSSHELR
jgi:CheY-like chemotaxis protein